MHSEVQSEAPEVALQPASTRCGWPVFLSQIQKDFKFWLFILLWLAVFRMIMLAVFAKSLGPAASWQAIIKSALTGAQFDVSTATYWTLLPLMGSLATVLGLRERFAERLRATIAAAFAVLSTFLGIAAIGFFSEYKDHFNHWIFGLLFDDLRAILRTVWASYPVIPATIGIITGSALTWWLSKRFIMRPFSASERLEQSFASWPRRTAGLVLLALLIIAGLRGSVMRRPIQLKDAAVTGDPVLNKMVVNPYFALRYAIAQQFTLMRGADLRVLWPGGDIREAAKAAFPGLATYDDLDAIIERTAKGSPATRPKHIFLVIMESYDAWPFLDRYKSLGLVEGARTLSKDGILIRAFVSGGTGTMASVGELVTGLPEAGAVVNYQPASRKPFPTTAPGIFKQLGYRTRMFYAGYLSWQRFGDFCKDQGFAEIYGGGDMVKGRISREWGVEDDQLFDFVLQRVNDDQPSFNVILSAGYHRPWTTDVYGKGFPLHEVPEALRPLWENEVSLNALGHFWFADQCLSNFIVRAEQQLPDAVLAATGDHWSRDFLNKRPTAYERSAVLMLWRGKNVLPPVEDTAKLAGSHLDILPTLVELAAPAGFKYHAFGEDLFAPDRKQIGWGIHATIGPDFIVNHSKLDEALALWDMQPRPLRPEEKQALRQGQALRALGWWRLRNGPELPATKQKR